MILYICKHNVFRSRIAEEYSKQKGLECDSAGLILTEKCLPPLYQQFQIAKDYGLLINFKPKPITIEMLQKTDKLIIVANDVPKSLFEHTLYNLENKIQHWEIEDIRHDYIDADSRKTINKIMKLVDRYYK